MNQGQQISGAASRRPRGAAIGMVIASLLGAAIGGTGVAICAGLCLVVVFGPFRRSAAADGDGAQLRRHLARARRRDEAVDLFVAPVDDDARRLQRLLRVTDSSAITRLNGEDILCAMVDRFRLDRRSLQDRLEATAGRPIVLGWARFPEDGYTVASLVDHAVGSVRSQGPAVDAHGATPAVNAADRPSRAWRRLIVDFSATTSGGGK